MLKDAVVIGCVDHSDEDGAFVTGEIQKFRAVDGICFEKTVLGCSEFHLVGLLS